jgi:hypothetical protein
LKVGKSKRDKTERRERDIREGRKKKVENKRQREEREMQKKSTTNLHTTLRERLYLVGPQLRRCVCRGIAT